MNIDDLLPSEKQVLPRFLRLAVERWDWESPTLYGLSLDDVQAVLREWPASLVERKALAALTILNVMADFTSGANPIREADFSAQFGVTISECEVLLEKLKGRVDILS